MVEACVFYKREKEDCSERQRKREKERKKKEIERETYIQTERAKEGGA